MNINKNLLSQRKTSTPKMVCGVIRLTLSLTCIYGGGRVHYVGSTTLSFFFFFLIRFQLSEFVQPLLYSMIWLGILSTFLSKDILQLFSLKVFSNCPLQRILANWLYRFVFLARENRAIFQPISSFYFSNYNVDALRTDDQSCCRGILSRRLNPLCDMGNETLTDPL